MFLEGQLAKVARDTIHSIASEISDVGLDVSLGPDKVVDLAHGKAGRAIFFEYLARSTNSSSYVTRSRQLLDESLEALGEMELRPWLYYGFTGIAWAHVHLGGDPELLEPIDEALLEHISIDPWIGRCDVAVGLSGYGVYFLDRPATKVTEAALVKIERHLIAAARSEGAQTWWPNPAWISTIPVDLGALGTGGIVGFLASAWPRLTPEARALLPGALTWLWEHLAPSLRETGPTTGWCAPLVAIAMLRAARRLDSEAWWERGMILARNLAQGPVLDTSFYRGVAGVAHMLHRIYRATRDETIAEAARPWFQRLVDSRTPGEGIAGYRTISPDTGELTAYPGITMGAAGIGLVLLAATSDVEPAWDRVFQLDL